MHRTGICLNLFSYLFTFSEIWGSIKNFLLENRELISVLGILTAFLPIFIYFPYRGALKFLLNTVGRFLQNNENYSSPPIRTTPRAIKRKELSELRRSFKNKDTKVIVITGDIRSGKTWLAEMFLKYVLKKRIKLRKYSVMRYDLRTISSKEELLTRISNSLKEQGKERLQAHMIEKYELDEVQKTLIKELNSTRSILFLDNFNPDTNRPVLDLINSTMKFYDSAKVIIVSSILPREFDCVDMVHGIVKNVNVDCYNLAEISDILAEFMITHSVEDTEIIRRKTNGNPYEVALFIHYLQKHEVSDLSDFDYMSIFEEQQVRDVEERIINMRYRRVYLNFDEETKIIPQILSALCFPCTLEDLQNLFNQFIPETGMSDEYKEVKLKSCLNDNLEYNLVCKEGDTYFLDDSIKELIYHDFSLRDNFHEKAKEYFEKKSSESPLHKEEYYFQKEKYKEITEMKCPKCGKTVSKKDRTCKYCRFDLGKMYDDTQIY
jgi:AAA+ ATPase superfamily predicted ATPase